MMQKRVIWLNKDELGSKVDQLQAILSRVVVLSSFAFES